MKIYIWKNNRTDSDFTEVNNFSESGHYHSACLVVLAESMEEAKKYGEAHRIKYDPIEIETTKHGDIVYADGEC